MKRTFRITEKRGQITGLASFEATASRGYAQTHDCPAEDPEVEIFDLDLEDLELEPESEDAPLVSPYIPEGEELAQLLLKVEGQLLEDHYFDILEQINDEKFRD